MELDTNNDEELKNMTIAEIEKRMRKDMPKYVTLNVYGLEEKRV